MNNGGFNQIVLVGTITNAPQERGNRVKSAVFELTTERFWRDRMTQLEQKSSQRHQVVAFEELRDVVLDHGKEGQTVLVVGMMQYYGRDVLHAEVKADFFKILKD